MEVTMADDIQQPPDDLKKKESSDLNFVTEELAKMNPWIHRALAIWFLLIATASISWIVQLWPAEGSELPGVLERSYLLLTLLFGLLGGSAHGLGSLMDFRGQRRLFRSWTLWYFMIPILGGIMAFIFYVAIRAGLLTADATRSINAFGVAAISVLVGLFTDDATNKLAEVFRTMFKTAGKEREGELSPGGPPSKEPG
jgi:hypothetical protein